MRYLFALLVCSSCATSPEAPLSNATFSGSAMVHSSRAQPSDIFYGAPFHRWVITLATIEGCTGDTVASVEVTTLSSTTAIPIATVPLRTVLDMPAPLPSAFVTYSGATTVSGSVTIESATSTFVVGSLTAQMMVNGTPTDVTASFGANVCP